jgi:mRNA interferase HigB
MHIISRKTLVIFWEGHTNAENALRSWFARTKRAEWQNLAELKQTFPAADQVGRLTVFNIGGNRYRLIARVEYEQQRVYIRHVLTHAEYDKGAWKNDPWNS